MVVQDTGFSEFIPTGDGLLAFSNCDQAAQSLLSVEADYPKHRKAAQELAGKYFAFDIVLGELLTRVGL